MGITRRFRNYFLRGLAILLPTILTIWIFVWGYKFIQENISIHINRWIVDIIMSFNGDHDGITREAWEKVWIDGAGSVAGFVIALVAVCMIGALLASVVGKSLWRMIEKFIMNTPLLKQIYPYIKQVTDFLLTQDEQRQLISGVVAVEYPRRGVWSVGMVTGSGLKKVVDNFEKEFLTVLIPTSPTPFTGFVIMVPKEDTIELDLTMEEALRFVVSGGVIIPGSNQAGALPAAGSAAEEK